MVSCRCHSSCKGNDTCPGTKEAPTFRAHGVTKKLDMVQARQLLNEKGHFKLTPNFPAGQVQASFQRNAGKSLFEVCQKIEKEAQLLVYRDLPISLRRYYGVSCKMSSKRFLRSLFLVFTEGASIAEGHFPEVTVGMAYSSVATPEGTYYMRMTTIYRLYSASHQPIEIRLEREGLNWFLQRKDLYHTNEHPRSHNYGNMVCLSHVNT